MLQSQQTGAPVLLGFAWRRGRFGKNEAWPHKSTLRDRTTSRTQSAGRYPLCRPSLLLGSCLQAESAWKVKKARIAGNGTHDLGGLASLLMQAPWLCVPTSRSVCPFEILVARLSSLL